MTEDVVDGGHVSLLTPPVFNSQCSRCGVWKRILPWIYVDVDGCWGQLCDKCAAPMLASSLRPKLQNRFSVSEFINTCLQQLGLESKRAAFLLEDFVKQGFVFASEDRFCWHEESTSLEVIEPLVKRKPRHVFRRKTGEEIFAACVKLSREIRGRPEPIREPDQGGR